MELTIGQIIKVVIAALVFVVVVLGVVLGFNSYIVPYFTEIGPSGIEKNLDTQYYQDLLDDENLVATVVEVRGENAHYLNINGEQTNYYFWKENVQKIYEDDYSFWNRDNLIGILDNNGIVDIENPVNDNLKSLDGGEKIGRAIYKIGGVNAGNE